MTLVRLGRGGPRAFVAWSGGKNAAHALYRVRSSGRARIEGLLTLVNEEGEVPESRVPAALVREQAEAAGLELVVARIGPEPPSSLAGEAGEALATLRGRGIEALVFGDPEGSTTLEAHRAFSEAAGLEPIFPLSEDPPDALAETMLKTGHRAVLTAVDRSLVARAFVGRTFSRALLDEMPAGAHPTGGRGEFHTFECGSPALRSPISPRWADLEHIGTWAIARLVPGPRRGYGEGSVDF